MTHDPGSAFRALHRPGAPFILANAWDIGTARMLAGLGAEALGTSSAAHAFTLGRPDGQVSRREALAHARALVGASPLPVSGDFENGFSAEPAEVARTVRLACDTGLAGLSIEDTDLPGKGAYGFDDAVARIKAAVAARERLPRDMVLVARADGCLTGAYGLEEALRRIRAFAEAGACCVYVPAPGGPDALRRVVEATDKPVNALAAGQLAKLSRAEFAEIGVARISLGSGLARAAQRTIRDAAVAMFGEGNFNPLRKTVPGEEIDALLRAGSPD